MISMYKCICRMSWSANMLLMITQGISTLDGTTLILHFGINKSNRSGSVSVLYPVSVDVVG